MREIWKNVTVQPYCDYYMVSNLGNVKRIKECSKYNTSSKRLGILNQPIGSWGYKVVSLTVDGKSKSILVHRLVATAFIPNPENKPQVNHIDGNKLNNRADNLEWVTQKENIQHAFGTGLNRCIRVKNLKPVYQFDMNKHFLRKWKNGMQASKELNISDITIYQCCHNIRHSAGGFFWSFSSECNPRPLKISEKHNNGVNQYDINGTFICHYQTIKEAASKTVCSKTAIIDCCSGKSESSKGFKWEYA